MDKLEEKLKILRTLVKNKDYAQARIEGEKLIFIYSANAELNYLMGTIYDRLNLLKRADEFLQNSISLDPNYYDALVELSLFNEKNGAKEKASLYRERAFRVANKLN
jgi:tetratricopeptide (TPR) repeat protein